MVFELRVQCEFEIKFGGGVRSRGFSYIYFHWGAHILLIIPSIITPFNWAKKRSGEKLKSGLLRSNNLFMFRSTCRHRPILTAGSVIYVIQAWKFSTFPRISAFCVCLGVIFFFTLKTRVFIAKRTKNRNVGPTKLRKTIGKYYIAQDWNNNDRNPRSYLPSVPILAGHPDFRPS